MFVLRVSRSAYMRAIKMSLASAVGFLLTIILMSTAAYAVAIPPGPSCAATNTGLLNLNCPGGTNCSRGGTFSAGETITFNLNIVGGPFSLTVNPGGGGVSNATNSTTFVYLVPADGFYTFSYNNAANASVTSITATCAGANTGATMVPDTVRHQVSNHWSSILGIYAEHRTPLPFQNAAPDDAFQDGTGTAPSISGGDGTVAFQASVRGLIF